MGGEKKGGGKIERYVALLALAVTAALMGQRCVDIMVAHEHQLLLFVHAFCVICSRLRVLTDELRY